MTPADARELLHLLVTGEKRGSTPPLLTSCCAVLPVLNDGPWADDAHRSRVLLPWLPRLAALPRDEAHDQRRAFALADYAVRVIAAESLAAVGRTGKARRLRTLPPLRDADTAYAARVAARAVTHDAAPAGSAAWAAYAAGTSKAADAAAWAAYAAAQAARAEADHATVLERHALALLTIIEATP